MENLDCINRLNNSPMFAMSLGSKELFHSNFWAWIMENADPDKLLLHLFFDDIDEFYKNKGYVTTNG